MAGLILKSPYLKPGGKKQPGGYLKYIATREGVELAEDTSRHLPATAEQQKQIKALIKKHPQSKESHEYEDYMAKQIFRKPSPCSNWQRSGARKQLYSAWANMPAAIGGTAYIPSI